MKKAVAFAVVLLCLLVMVSCGDKKVASDNDTDTSGVETDQAVEYVRVKTPYCDLVVPDEFEGNVKSEVSSQEPYVVSFKTVEDDAWLFSLYSDSEAENLLGTLELDDRNVVVYAAFGDFDREDANFETYCAYQEGINTIIEHLISDYRFVVDQIVVIEDNSTFDIQTPVVTMKYPNKWKEKVDVTVTEDAVKFESNGVSLFELVFTECDGYLLGTYDGTPIYIVDNMITEEAYPDEELYEFYAMQEDVNVILQNLMEDDKFIISY